MATLGGISTEVKGNRCSPEIDNLARFAVEENTSTPKIDSLARFAVEEHNKKSNAVLQFVKVMSAVLQNAVLHFGKVVGSRRSPHLRNNGNMVGGDVYCLTLEAFDGRKKKVYEAQVWKKPWLNFKALKEFKLISDAPSGSRA